MDNVKTETSAGDGDILFDGDKLYDVGFEGQDESYTQLEKLLCLFTKCHVVRWTEA